MVDTLHEDLCTFMIISRWMLPKMRNFSDKTVGKIKTHMLCSVFSENLVIYWANVEKCSRAGQATDDSIIWSMCFAC